MQSITLSPDSIKPTTRRVLSYESDDELPPIDEPPEEELSAVDKWKIRIADGKFWVVCAVAAIPFILLIVSLDLVLKKQFPIYKPKQVLTAKTNRLGGIFYVIATNVNVMLMLFVIINDAKHALVKRQTASPIKFSSFAVFLTGGAYSAYRSYFQLTPKPSFDCTAEHVIIAVLYGIMKGALAWFYTYRLDVPFKNSKLAYPKMFILGLRVFIVLNYGIMCLLFGLNWKGKLVSDGFGGFTCSVKRNVNVVISFFVMDAIINGFLLYCFLDRLRQTLNIKFSKKIAATSQKHAFLSAVGILSTWIFSLLGLMIGIEFVLFPIDVLLNGVCVFLMFAGNSYEYVWCCGCFITRIFGEDSVVYYKQTAIRELSTTASLRKQNSADVSMSVSARSSAISSR